MNTFIIQKAILATLFFTTQSCLIKAMASNYPIISKITNNSPKSIFISLTDKNSLKWWDQKKQDFIQIDYPIEISSGSSVYLTIPIPRLNDEYELKRQSPALSPNLLSPARLSIKTSRKIGSKNIKSEEKFYFQQAEFNIFLGNVFTDQGYLKYGFWAQKIVNEKDVTQISILCDPTRIQNIENFELLINENGCPVLWQTSEKDQDCND